MLVAGENGCGCRDWLQGALRDGWVRWPGARWLGPMACGDATGE